MKNFLLTTMIVLLSVSFSTAQNVDVLPQNSRDFIDEHFATETLEDVKKEDSWYNWDETEMYEVHFSNGIKLDFNKEGKVTEIDSKNEPIPFSVLPQKVRSYLEMNESDVEVMSWETEDDEQELSLADGRDLEFNSAGEFLKED